jgi:acetyl esterase/lipase
MILGSSRDVGERRSRFPWKRLLLFLIAAPASFAVYRLPARRNYFRWLGDAVVRQDIPYAGDLDPKRQLDLYLPRGAREPFPLVVFVHGGYTGPLDRRWMLPILGVYGNIGVALAHRGVGAAVIGYRQYPQIEDGDASIDDVAAAIRFVRDSAAGWGGDPRRVFVMGHSAGGHLAALLAMHPELLQQRGVMPREIAGFISVDGIFDLAAALTYMKPEEAAILRRLFGPDDARLTARSPISFVPGDHPSMLFVDSTNDDAVCLDGFHAMRARMREAKSRATFVELPGIGHDEMAVRVGMDGDLLTPLVIDFIEQKP